MQPVAGRPVVLVVDDEHEHCELLGYLLRREYRVLLAQGSERALDLARASEIELAIVDFRMPGMNGIELLAELRRLQPDCIRFLVTAYADPKMLQDAINLAGVYHFVGKPLDADMLRLDMQRAFEHKRTEHQLVRSQKFAILGELAGSVAHDLRNYLQALTFAPALLRNPGADGFDSMADQLEEVCQGMNDLVTELLALAQGKKPEYSLSPARLDLLVERTCRVWKKMNVPDRVLTVDIEPNLPAVPLSQNRFQRMLINLLKNAADATRSGGHLRVRLWQRDQHLALEVWDDGPGIPAAIRDRIFDPLFTTKGTQGVGLGLAICRAVMEAHGGTLECGSEPGHGTSFIASFPAPAR
jgi:signal transduction histidine kinase